MQSAWHRRTIGPRELHRVRRVWAGPHCRAESRFGTLAALTWSSLKRLAQPRHKRCRELVRGDMSEAREDRFCELYELSRPKIVAYALRRAASRDDAADIVAETFEIAWRRLDDVPTGEAGLLWLYVTARFVLANHGRRVRRRDEVTVRLAEELRGLELREEAPDAKSVVMRLCLNSLTPDERELLMLAGWEGLNAAQMGRVLGCSPTAARIRLHRARARLTSEMADFAAAEKRPGRVGHIQVRGTATSTSPQEVRRQ